MPERWLGELNKIGQLEPNEDLLERAERGPSAPERGARSASRLTAAVLAVVIAVAGISVAYAAFSRTGRVQPSDDGTTGFTATTWPETSLAEAQQVQARVDSGDPAVQWRKDPAAVGLHFSRAVLGWSNTIAGETVTNDPDTIIVSLHGPDASCNLLPTGQDCSIPSPQSIVTLTLRRLVRSGDGGIWSVTASDGAAATASGS